MNPFNESVKFLSMGSIKLIEKDQNTEYGKVSLKVGSVRMTKGFLFWDLSLERSYMCAGIQIPSVALEPTGFVVLTLCSYLMAINSHQSETPA